MENAAASANATPAQSTLSQSSPAQANPQSFTKHVLTGLRADAFRHPLDREATQSLRQLPGADLLVRQGLAPSVEQFFYLDNIASSIQVSDKQLPDLHRALTEACQILDLEIPQLYIRQNAQPNAYTFAMRGQKPFIVVHSSLLDLLTPEEVQAVIAHELGHLKCDHGVYLTLANILVLAAGQLPGWGGWLASGLSDRLMEWVRCAEFTCDRAALLVMQDARVVASVLMKLAGGSPLLAQQLNLDAFLEQARAYDLALEEDLGELLQEIQTAPLSHPLPVLRAREIDRWAKSSLYHSLLYSEKSRYTTNLSKTEPLGRWRNW